MRVGLGIVVCWLVVCSLLTCFSWEVCCFMVNSVDIVASLLKCVAFIVGITLGLLLLVLIGTGGLLVYGFIWMLGCMFVGYGICLLWCL